jgi:hypothetical protein
MDRKIAGAVVLLLLALLLTSGAGELSSTN